MSYIAAQRQWIEGLRAKGVKAAHPDDGWVNREKNRVHLCYPHFDDGLEEGNLLALGSPPMFNFPGRCRIVRVTGSSDNMFAIGLYPRPWYWHFSD